MMYVYECLLVHAMAYMCRSEYNLVKLVLFFHLYMRSGDQIHVVRLGHELLFSLSHLTNLI